MNQFSRFTLIAFRKIYSRVFGSYKKIPEHELNADIVSNIIMEKLLSNQSSMIARFGSTELNLLTNYIGVKNKNRKLLSFINGKTPEWWWEAKKLEQLHTHSGFFPNKLEYNIRFCELMLEDTKQVDVLGSWRPEEIYFENELQHCKKIHLLLLEPFWAKEPWTKVLKGKKVLVVHPFAETIKKQYLNRNKLFKNQDVLPDFESLTVIKAVQTLGKADDRFKDWFDALDYMKSEIDKVDYDMCLIGAGAYGFPLAAHVKRSGKKAIHLGGSLQLLFGIKGARWENPNYHPVYDYSSLMNEYWIRPEKDEKPSNAESIEGGCYW